MLLDGRKLRDGGIGVYTQNLINGLLQVGGVEITVIYGGERPSAAFADRVSWIHDSARPYSIDELIAMPKRLDLSRFDIFHTPHYMLPYRISIPSVVTVHDLIHITHPEKFYYPYIAKRLIRSAVNRAAGVLAVSQHTRKSVLELTGADPSKVAFVPNAIADGYQRDSEIERTADLGEPYLFGLFSNLKPHKGFLDLIYAYTALRQRGAWRAAGYASCPQLLLAGYGTQDKIDYAALEIIASRDSGITLVGALSQSELRERLGKARALVVPSLAEGFCLPALEAKALGTPIICRPVPALLELVSSQDIVANDFSVASLAQALALGLSAKVDRDDSRALEQLTAYSCRNIGLLVRSEYQRILSQGRSV